jgi:hypothetical protein
MIIYVGELERKQIQFKANLPLKLTIFVPHLLNLNLTNTPSMYPWGGDGNRLHWYTETMALPQNA